MGINPWTRSLPQPTEKQNGLNQILITALFRSSVSGVCGRWIRRFRLRPGRKAGWAERMIGVKEGLNCKADLFAGRRPRQQTSH